MRDGIMNYLPTTFSEDGVVFVVGTDNHPGVNRIKGIIGNLNREKRWIREEFRPFTSGELPPKSFAVIALTGCGLATLAHVRQLAKKASVPCPNQTLTVGEVKDVLLYLNGIRQGLSPKEVDTPMVDDNGHQHTYEEPQKEVRQETTSAIETTVEVVQSELPTAQPTNEAAESALAVLERFGSLAEEAQLALLVVVDQLKVSSTECEGLRSELTAKDQQIVILTEKLREAHLIARENDGLSQENERLKGEVSRLQTALDNLDALIRGARGQ